MVYMLCLHKLWKAIFENYLLAKNQDVWNVSYILIEFENCLNVFKKTTLEDFWELLGWDGIWLCVIFLTVIMNHIQLE